MADAHKTSVAGSLATTFSEKLKVTSAKFGGDQKVRPARGGCRQDQGTCLEPAGCALLRENAAFTCSELGHSVYVGRS